MNKVVLATQPVIYLTRKNLSEKRAQSLFACATRAEDISESSSSKKKLLLTSRDEGSDQSEQTVRKRLRRGSMRPKGGPLLHV